MIDIFYTAYTHAIFITLRCMVLSNIISYYLVTSLNDLNAGKGTTSFVITDLLLSSL